MRRDKKASVDLTVGRLLRYILALIFLALVLWGLTQGGYGPLFEQIGGKVDSILILLNIKDKGQGDLECFERPVEESIGSGEFISSMEYLREGDFKFSKAGSSGNLGLDSSIYQGSNYKKNILKVCKEGVHCSFVSGKSLFAYDTTFEELYLNNTQEVPGSFFSEEHKYSPLVGKGWTNLEEYLFEESKSDSVFYWEFYSKGSDLIKSKGLEDVFNDMYGEVGVFYSNAYDENSDSLIYAVGWNENWEVYAMTEESEKTDSVERIAAGLDNEGMIKIMKKHTDDLANADNDLYFIEVTVKESAEDLLWRALSFSKSDLISEKYSPYDSDNDLDGNEDDYHLKRFIKKDLSGWGDKINLRNNWQVWKTDLEQLIGMEVIIMEDVYIVKEIYAEEYVYPLVVFEGPRGEYGMGIGNPSAEAELSLLLYSEEDQGDWDAIEGEDFYRLKEDEFLEKYIVTSVYELMEEYC